ncbi:MAG: family 65 glycosyl hydrolase [Oscillospiraceae bacterium]|nr:family 65 glycosyl hydrolase [Oscillospiraceae bacterium]MCL2279430.1 family 65 glycosyl hydrolase [Oscillospiraceae bacterium]
MILKSTCLDENSLLLEETLYHVANGYLGVRGNFEEKLPLSRSVRGFYLNGFYDTVELQYPEKLFGFPENVQRMINLPDVQTMRIYFDGEALDPLGAPLVEYYRTLDTADGLAKRTIKYSHSGGIITLCFTRMASFVRPELFLTLVKIEGTNVSGFLEIHAGVDSNVRNYSNPDDPRVAAEAISHIVPGDVTLLDDGGIVSFSTTKSELHASIVQRFSGNFDSLDIRRNDGGFSAVLSHKLSAGESLSLAKFTVISDSRHVSDPAANAIAIAEKCVLAGKDKIIAEQRQYLERFRAAAMPEISGCPDIERALDFNIFSLLQSTARDGVSALASKGISGEGYEGHYFWDTETYCFPFFLFTQPETAKSLLEFRYNTLSSAREHAKILGHTKGALFPWRTISGSECSSYFPSGSAQYHINGDIAHSFAQYWYATGDMDFMASKGAEVLVETARLWLEVGHFAADGLFHIHTVTGPDEYTCLINNNYYTNRCAEANLRSAAVLCTELWEKNLSDKVVSATGVTRKEVELFIKAANSMYFPYDEKLDIHAQDDSFLSKKLWDLSSTPKENFPLLLHYHPLFLYRHQVCKQADTVLSHFLFEDGITESTMRNSFDYYEKITTHDSSLSRCVFSIMAARLGMTDKAYDYYMDTLYTDLENTHGNTKDGLHTANLGGSWLALVMGFAGLRLKADGLHFAPHLPSKWESVSFKLCFRGRILSVCLYAEKMVFSLLSGDSFRIFVDGQSYLLETQLTV